MLGFVRMANREKRAEMYSAGRYGKRQEDVTEQEEQATDADSSTGNGSPIQRDIRLEGSQ